MFILEEDLCIQCGTCVEGCHEGALVITDDKLIHDKNKCNWCGHCLALCPRDAIMIDGDGYDIDDVEEFNLLTRPTVQQIRRQVMMRRSVFNFTDDEVTEKELGYIVEAAKYAPTENNKQGNAILVVRSDEGREEFKNIINDIKAPVFIFVFSDSEKEGAVCAHTMMQMVDAQPGLGASYIDSCPEKFDDDLKNRLHIPTDKKCVMAFCLGHTEQEFFSSVPRKSIPVIWR